MLNSKRIIVSTVRSWNSKGSRHQGSPFFYLSPFLLALLFFFFLFLFLTCAHIPKPLFSFSIKSAPRELPQCKAVGRLGKFLFYAPHSGFNNQLSELKNAIILAGILNRTLIIPPVLDHHAVALGSCPKFRVLGPPEIRIAVWDHVIDLLRSGRYVSMAEIVDISSLQSSSLLQAIDLRNFMSLWCGINIEELTCSDEVNSQSPLFDHLKLCGSFLFANNGHVDKCVYAVNEDCRTTVWTYQIDGTDGALDSFQPDEQLKQKKEASYVRRRRDVFKALGAGSEAESAALLAFGSLFSTSYRGSESHIDIKSAPTERRIQSLIEKIEFLHFVPEIIRAGKQFAVETIKAPFICAQIRLLDGQFKNHREATLRSLKQKLDSLLNQEGHKPVHIFAMTDLPEGNWTGNYLGDLVKDSHNFKLFFLREEDELVTSTARRIVSSGLKKHCSHVFPDVLLHIEQTVCSCASLGFVGTAGSTIAETIEAMRKSHICFTQTRR